MVQRKAQVKAEEAEPHISFSMGSVEQPTPTTNGSSKRKHGNRLQIKHLPGQVSKEDIVPLISAFGNVLNVDIVKHNRESQACVTYESLDQAQKAFESLQNYAYQGSSLKVELVNNNNVGRQNKGHPRLSSGSNGGNTHSIALPLRILVPSEFVGAIIGKKGQSIKMITTRCKARVDVHGKENTDLVEKVISIYGQPENCTKACKEILQVMEHEAVANVRGEVSLKMLTNDRFCGRLIGKEGRMIKKIREETGTKIVVTNAQEMIGLYPERVISIRGTVDNMVKAEAAIYTKLVECAEQDMKSPAMANGMMNGGLPNMPGGYYPLSAPNGMMNQNYYSMYNPSANQPMIEQCQVIIPNSAVGAIIGSSGSNIKQMMRDSGAFITVEHKTEDNLNPSSERIVSIKGSTEACWRANYFVFEKMKVEGFSGNDDVRLKTVIRVPKNTVGRIIGKGGKNVREIQRLTGGIVRLPQLDQIMMMSDNVHVEVFGNFMATQSAHSRIRSVVNQILQQSYSSTYCGPYQGMVMPSHVDYQQ